MIGRPHRDDRSDLQVAAGLFLLSILVRWLFLRGTVDRDLPFSIFYYGDSRLYREFALAILQGRIFDSGIPYHPPLLAYLLAAIIRVTGESPGALRALVAIPAALTPPLTYLLGVRLWSRPVALIGALLATFSFGLCVTAVSPNTEAIYIPILVGQALAVVAFGDALGARSEDQLSSILRKYSVWLAVLTGLLLGLRSLTDRKSVV